MSISARICATLFAAGDQPWQPSPPSAVVVMISVFLILGGVMAVLLFWFLPWLFFRFSEKRTTQFQQAATEIGLPFSPAGDDGMRDFFAHFPLFSRGTNTEINNMLHGETANVELAIFDYQYILGSGDNQRTVRQNVLFSRSPRLNLPHFEAVPQRLYHSIGKVFGYQDIDFAESEEFSAKYVLRGRDQPKIRDLFNAEVRAVFEDQTDSFWTLHWGAQRFTVEGGDDQLVLYRDNTCIKPHQLRQFMEDGFRFFTPLRDSNIGS